MVKNMGNIDRLLRIIIGLVLIWYALLAPATGYNWIGWLGFIPLATATIGSCPLYSIIGINTCGASKA